MMKLHIQKKGIFFIVANLLALAIMLIAILASPAAFSMHHVVLVYPFLIMAMFNILSELRGDKVISLLLLLFIVINIYQFYKLTGMDYREWERNQSPGHALVPRFQELNELLNRYSGDYVFVHVDWGFYSLKALYGNRDQCNVQSYHFCRQDQVRMVQEICRKTGRKAMFIRMKERSGTDPAFIREHFPGIVPMELNFDTGLWGVWYEP